MRVGVLGSMVWDRIDHPDGDPIERWGGIAYSLAAAIAAAPSGWTVRPIIKVGADLAAEAAAFLETLPGLELPGGVVRTPEPNNRVHLRYRDRHHREEHLTGGVPPWRWPELAPLLAGLDALYVNLISGFELELATATRLRSTFPGFIYMDLHSLLLGTDPSGHRVPRRIDGRDRWLTVADVVQVNETELAWLGEPEDPWQFGRRAVRRGLRALLVTRGPGGASALAAGDDVRSSNPLPGPVRRTDIPVQEAPPAGDPTGCGDVWGATCFVALVRGEPLGAAMGAANAAGARNVAHRGADELYTFLTEVA